MHRLTSLSDRASLRFFAGTEFPQITRQRPHELKLALIEAEALALETEFPDLVVLDLAKEKLESLTRWHMRQLRIGGGAHYDHRR